jgi:ELWxxDGT repeat protein
LFFSATNGISGQELYRSNGTAPGTVIIKVIRPGSSGSYPHELTNVNGTLFFVANDGIHGDELYESNGIGTGQGTILVKDINIGAAGSSPSNLTNVNGTLFFSATAGVSGVELWRSNGTTPGTVLIKIINPGGSGSHPSELTSVGSTLFFVANDGVDGQQLYESNGTAAGTGLEFHAVSNLRPYEHLTNIIGRLFFSTDVPGSGFEPCVLSGPFNSAKASTNGSFSVASALATTGIEGGAGAGPMDPPPHSVNRDPAPGLVSTPPDWAFRENDQPFMADASAPGVSPITHLARPSAAGAHDLVRDFAWDDLASVWEDLASAKASGRPRATTP